MDRAIATRLIGKANSRANPRVIDYEHQTLYSEKNGQPAPAAGWFKTLEWREGKGLFATAIEWTTQAKRYIEEKAYRYISPVFFYDPETGEVLDVLSAALTNNPAIDGMLAAGELAQLCHRANGNQALSKAEAEVCQMMGISENAFANGRNIPSHQTAALKQTLSSSLSKAEMEVIRVCGLNPIDYLNHRTNKQS